MRHPRRPRPGATSWQDHQPFAHLHVHTEYSMLDGAARLKDLMAEVKARA